MDNPQLSVLPDYHIDPNQQAFAHWFRPWQSNGLTELLNAEHPNPHCLNYKFTQTVKLGVYCKKTVLNPDESIIQQSQSSPPDWTRRNRVFAKIVYKSFELPRDICPRELTTPKKTQNPLTNNLVFNQNRKAELIKFGIEFCCWARWLGPIFYHDIKIAVWLNLLEPKNQTSGVRKVKSIKRYYLS